MYLICHDPIENKLNISKPFYMNFKSTQDSANLFFKLVFVLFLLIYGAGVYAQKPHKIQSFIDPAPFQDNTNHWYSIADKNNMINALPDRPRYKPTEIKNPH